MLLQRTSAAGTWSSSLVRQQHALQAPQYVLPDADSSPRAGSRTPRNGHCAACISPLKECVKPLERRLETVCLSLTPTIALIAVAIFFVAAYYSLEELEGRRAAVPHHEVQDLLRADYLRQHGFPSGVADGGAV